MSDTGMIYGDRVSTDPMLETRSPASAEELRARPVVLPQAPYVAAPYWDPLHRSAEQESVYKSRLEGAAAELSFKVAPLKGYWGNWSGMAEAVQKSFVSGGNFGYQMYRNIERKVIAGDQDPNWRPDKWLDQYKDRIPLDRRWHFMQTNNQTEAELMFGDMQFNDKTQELLSARTGISPFITDMIAGAVDVDLPLAVIGGKLLTTSGKMGLTLSKAGRVGLGAAGGGFGAASSAYVGYMSNPSGDWTSIPVAGLLGMTLGGIVGGLSKGHIVEDLANVERDKTLNEFGETLNEGAPLSTADPRESVPATDGFGLQEQARVAEEARLLEEATNPAPKGETAPAGRAPKAMRVEDLALETFEPGMERGSIGARQLAQQGPGVASIVNTKSVDIIQAAKKRDQQMGISGEWHSNSSNLGNVSPGVENAARRFQDVLNKIPYIGSDFSRLMSSGSSVATMLAHDMFSNASGIIRNRRSAAALKDEYERQMLGRFQGYSDDFDEWAINEKKVGLIKRSWDNTLSAEFDENVITEIMYRKYGGSPPANTSAAVKRAADRVADTFEKEIDIVQGRPGETPVHGSQALVKDRGYYTQLWSSVKFNHLVNVAKTRTRDQLADDISEIYRVMNPTLNPKDSKLWATAVVDRTLQGAHFNANLYGILQQDGRAMVERLLERNGVSKADATRLIDDLLSVGADKSKPGHMKQRMDVDMRLKTSSGLRMMDLFDTDVRNTMERRARGSAGSAALARIGITNHQDWDAIVQAILDEQSSNGVNAKSGPGIKNKINDTLDKDTQLTKEYLDDLRTYFGGGPIGGGLSASYSRARKLTNLALLNQLGLTQMAEFGPMIAAMGVQRFTEMIGKEWKHLLGGPESELMKELKHFNVFVPEERMFRYDMHHELDRVNAVSELGAKVDNFLNKAQRVQGFVSGFYHVRDIQQKMAVSSMADKVMQTIKGATQMSADRLRDMGMDAGLMARINKYVQNGDVEFQNGQLYKLNLDKWDPADAEDFSLALNQSSYQLVQRAMAGESNVGFHKDGLASLFVHLKSFPILAIEKQFMRNARMADNQAMMEFAYGLAAAAAVYAAKQVINGREDNLDPVSVAKGAFNMSNMTGWIPMWVDPLGAMLGMNVGMGGYSVRGSSDVLSVPASMTTLNQMSKIPGALISYMADTQTTSDIRALQAAPIIGNAYGFSYMWNAMKRETSAKQAQQAKDRKAQEAIRQAEEEKANKTNQAKPKLSLPNVWEPLTQAINIPTN